MTLPMTYFRPVGRPAVAAGGVLQAGVDSLGRHKALDVCPFQPLPQVGAPARRVHHQVSRHLRAVLQPHPCPSHLCEIRFWITSEPRYLRYPMLIIQIFHLATSLQKSVRKGGFEVGGGLSWLTVGAYLATPVEENADCVTGVVELHTTSAMRAKDHGQKKHGWGGITD
jgi:hypothetical protein